MRKMTLIANWKMNLSVQDSLALARAIKRKIKSFPPKVASRIPEIVICPSFSALTAVASVMRTSDSLVHLGAQDCFWIAKGAYTGEESPTYLEGEGVRYVLVGHSERRMYLSETNQIVAKKVEACQANPLLTPVICVGENREERSQNLHKDVIREQLATAIVPLKKLKKAAKAKEIIIAYEPVWAIGTGVACTAKDCADMYAFIKNVLRSHVGSRATLASKILYGGSVNSRNINDFIKKGVSDGALVGGASLDPDEFASIIATIAYAS